ncbi:restriction endonuclease subunit S [Priestia megaterium]|uniref:restriction endonuclease subunit S n=1 Tax=Priestia megaterium TaxID=1404 RepID=UPI001BE9C134|nr:restriction endonuclease subunit S [Priestia megaterium]MBT2253838.1 restriction endonuclease subunit S [Priestia megaterium]
MANYKLKDLIEEVISGEWGEELNDDSIGIKILRTTNFTNIGKLNLEKEVVLRRVESDKVAKKHLIAGDTIIEKSGGSPEQPVGRVVFFEENELYLCNNFTSILRPKKDLIEPKYLMYLLFNLYRQRKVLKFQNKTTGIINLKLDQYLNKTKVDIPSKENQLKIVDALDQTFDLIEKRQSQIEALDKLIQSVFLEMFGDPLRNKKWKNILFGEVCESKLGKMLDKKNQEDLSQKYYIGNRHVQWGNFQLDDLPLMGFKDTELEKYALKKGDILICEGGEVGRCAIWQWDDKEIYYQKALHRARVKSHLATSEFIQYVLYLYANNGGFKDFTSTATIAHLTAAKLNKLPIPLPPLELQLKFSNRYYAILNQKKVFESGLIELENLYQSIFQKAFKGDIPQDQV